MPDWSLLPEDLLHIISTHLENCFDVVHARSVCSSWRSALPLPCILSRLSYSLPSYAEFPYESEDLFTLKKVPWFLFRVRTPSAFATKYFLGGIGRRDESEDHTELPSPLQCSVKIPRSSDSEPTLMNMLDFQILSLGYEYRMFGWRPRYYRGVAFLPLNKEGGGEDFVVLISCSNGLLVLTSAEMKWKQLENVPKKTGRGVVTFGGKFYASFYDEIVVIDPYSLDVTLLMPSLQPLGELHYLVPYGNDELFLVDKCQRPFGLRVSRLDEVAGKWVEVTDLGNRVMFMRDLENFCCSAKELGVSGNLILFTNLISDLTFFYKYEVREEDGLMCWSVTFPGRYPVVAFRVEQASP
ncbi:unnamed protein product [Microthlaspi erraticum]|uniref:F-box domain-containing protein n=1 Tax=Microthlaspi erraticum TaxID=1685480 RepID=A0A6D2IZL9_9BRAS|nr:unnamed protein product [Microthlaspi erraticum]